MADFHFTANLLERYIQKTASEFTLNDIINYVFEKEIEMINLRYVAEDEKLHTLNFVVTGREELENLLRYGERVNGHAVFSYMQNDHPDLYVIPRYNTAFLNPFSEIPTIDLLCSFHTWDGEPLESAPANILQHAVDLFTAESTYDVKIFGELEFYVVSQIDHSYVSDESNYQSSAPFSKFEAIRVEAIRTIARCGGKIRFAHAEHGSFNLNNRHYEQHEIEFLPSSPGEAIDQLHIAKWVLRMIGRKHGIDIVFSPKVAIDQPGNGLHIHLVLEKDGINILGEGREFRKTAMHTISGILQHAGSITAFANTIPTSFLRLNDQLRAPHSVCWGPSNRSALIRIPKINMKALNDQSQQRNKNRHKQEFIYNQSIEYRGADPSASLYLFVAAILVAATHGLHDEEYLVPMKRCLVSENLNDPEQAAARSLLTPLPASCLEAAEQLLHDEDLYTENYPVFPKNLIQHLVLQHRQMGALWQTEDKNASRNNEAIGRMIEHFMHYR